MNEQIDWRLDEKTSVRRASVEDFDAVLAVVHDSTRRVQEMGFPQWKSYLTDEGIASIRRFVAGEDGAEVYLAERNGDGGRRAVGAFRIQWRDRECWGETGDDGRAGYIHMVAVHRDAKHEKLGERMIAMAERIIAARGRDFVRLDCWCRSPFLTSFYPQLGYTMRVVDGVPKGVMNFEKVVRR